MSIYGTCLYSANARPTHSGPPNQPMCCPLTADGMPMYTGQSVWDRNGDSYTVTAVWSECVKFEASDSSRYTAHCELTDDQGNVVHHPRWGNLFGNKLNIPKKD